MGSYWISRSCSHGEITWQMKEVAKGEYIVHIVDRPYRRQFGVKICSIGDGIFHVTKTNEDGIQIDEGHMSKDKSFEDKDGYRYTYRE